MQLLQPGKPSQSHIYQHGMLDIYPRATYNSQPYLLRGTAQELQRASAVRLYSQLFVAGVKAMPQEV